MSTMTQGAKIKRGQTVVGEVYAARKGFPARYGADKYDKFFVQDIRVGEEFKILNYDESTKEYTLLNLNLGTPNAWFKTNDQELDYILRRGATK